MHKLGQQSRLFFRGKQYWKFSIDPWKPLAGPRDIKANWPNLFESNITGAINWGSGVAYFFSGDLYARYLLEIKDKKGGIIQAEGVAKDPKNKNKPWIKKIKSNWRGMFPADVRSPLVVGFAGMHTLAYPGNKMMQKIWDSSNFTWTGFYLPSPSQKNSSWMESYEHLTGMGWGLAPIYVGQQPPGIPGSNNMTKAQGGIDGKDAVAQAATAFIPPSSVIYLDIEGGAPLAVGAAAYLRAWVDAVEGLGYRAGLYCSSSAAYEYFKVEKRPVFWVAYFDAKKYPFGSKATYSHPFPAPEPNLCGVEFAGIWHLAGNDSKGNTSIAFPPSVKTIACDLDSSCCKDPSNFSF